MQNYTEFDEDLDTFKSDLVKDLKAAGCQPATTDGVTKWGNSFVRTQIDILSHLPPPQQLMYFLRSAHLLSSGNVKARVQNNRDNDDVAEWLARCCGYIPQTGKGIHLLPDVDDDELEESSQLLADRVSQKGQQEHRKTGIANALKNYRQKYDAKKEPVEMGDVLEMDRMKFRIDLMQTMVLHGLTQDYLRAIGLKKTTVHNYFSVNQREAMPWGSAVNDFLRTLPLEAGQRLSKAYLRIYQQQNQFLSQITRQNIGLELDDPIGSRAGGRERDNRRFRAKVDILHRIGGGTTNVDELTSALREVIAELDIETSINTKELAQCILDCRRMYGSPPLTTGIPY